MDTPAVLNDMNSLPPAAQKQVVDFIAFLKARYTKAAPAAKATPPALAEEPFVGMWRDREDMTDSSGWVRELRTREWERRSICCADTGSATVSRYRMP
ncbi:MAG: hypothetical protein AUJ96_29785 [Armatimonadetes bacterium CG2_30_66_41]|nr:MAG: hypothetical protein AUJ96_29785 [Armatimonadetes bacterium CG2_30_66_41]